MTVSYNGWTASPSASAIGIKRFTVPGTRRTIYLRSSAAPILLWMMAWWHKYVEPIDRGIMDDWGYAYRETRGGGSISCHASGTAADVDATYYPRGMNRMSYAKQLKVRYMVRKVNKAAGKTLVKWGGEWAGAYKDQMHLELAPGTTPADVARAIRVLSDKPNIWVAAVVASLTAKTSAGKGAHPTSISRVQARLVSLGHLRAPYAKGYAGRKTRVAVTVWQRKHGFKTTGVLGETQLKALSNGVYEIV